MNPGDARTQKMEPGDGRQGGDQPVPFTSKMRIPLLAAK
jgi:hypothetical protein